MHCCRSSPPPPVSRPGPLSRSPVQPTLYLRPPYPAPRVAPFCAETAALCRGKPTVNTPDTRRRLVPYTQIPRRSAGAFCAAATRHAARGTRIQPKKKEEEKDRHGIPTRGLTSLPGPLLTLSRAAPSPPGSLPRQSEDVWRRAYQHGHCRPRRRELDRRTMALNVVYSFYSFYPVLGSLHPPSATVGQAPAPRVQPCGRCGARAARGSPFAPRLVSLASWF